MKQPIQFTDKLIRKSEVSQITGLSSTSIWRLSKADDFPKSIKIGGNAIRYSLNEVITWIETKKSKREGIRVFQKLLIILINPKNLLMKLLF